MRTATSAHRQRFGALKVRGPPGPHADGDVRAPSTFRRSQGARASRPAMRTGTSAYRQRFGALKVRGPPGPHAGWVAEAVTRPGSRRSGRAQLAHPAPRTMASLRMRAPASRRFRRLPASCRTCVETAAGSVARASVRPAVHWSGPPLPSAGSPWGGFPDFNGTISELRLLAARPAALRLPSLGGTTVRPVRSLGAGTPGAGTLLVWRSSAGPRLRWRRRDLPGSWATPACMPRSTTPAEPAAPGQSRRRRWCLPRPSRRRLPRSRRFRGSITRPARLPVYASQPGSPPDHATLGSGWLGPPWPVRSLTCWVAKEVSVMSIHAFLLHQASPGARRGRPRTVNGSALSRCAGLTARSADGDVRAPSTFRRSQGARASRPAMRTGTSAYRQRFGAQGARASRPAVRTGTSAHRQRSGALKVRGPHGPQCGRGRPRTVNGPALSRCAGFTARSADGMSAHRQRVGALKVRGLHGPQFGRGRAPPPDGQHFYPPIR